MRSTKYASQRQVRIAKRWLNCAGPRKETTIKAHRLRANGSRVAKFCRDSGAQRIMLVDGRAARLITPDMRKLPGLSLGMSQLAKWSIK